MDLRTQNNCYDISDITNNNLSLNNRKYQGGQDPEVEWQHHDDTLVIDLVRIPMSDTLSFSICILITLIITEN